MTEQLLISNAHIVTSGGRVETGSLLVKNGRITTIYDALNTPSSPDATMIDADGLMLVPGFIDLQVNGGFGLDFTVDPATIWDVAAQLPRFGVTSFLPTIVTSTPTTIRQAQEVVASGPPSDFAGATPLGLHLEGPFLNPAKKGAHNPAYLRAPDLTLAREWSPESSVRLVTLAPELPGALAVGRQLTEQSVVVSAGHSLATVDEACAGFDAGIRYGTHLFNAMPVLHHRQPGLAGALLADERVTIGLIADGSHVHPHWLKLVWQAAGERLNLVSDGMAAMGLGDGHYQLGDRDVTVQNGKASLADGTLAGSTITLDQSLRLMQQATGATLAQLVATITDTPAHLLGLANIGCLAPGCVADLVLLTAVGEVVMTWKAGRMVYKRGKKDVV